MNVIKAKLNEKERVIVDQGFEENHRDHGIANEENKYLSASIYEGDVLIGAVEAWIYHDWLYISDLWVRKKSRKQGLGTKLIQAIEDEAKILKVNKAHLWTASYEAEQFYLKNGYVCCLRLEDKPKGHERIMLKKSL